MSRDAAAEVGAAVLKEHLKRQELIRELEDAATRFEKQALDLPYNTGELVTYYRTKARNARARAAELREGKV
ncbi:MAG TPA: hypothetical protein VMF87_07955 [Streptosporangiaceae bacterium]|nr:hypothetical protein [Streptosporangiaceae bacterium]